MKKELKLNRTLKQYLILFIAVFIVGIYFVVLHTNPHLFGMEKSEVLTHIGIGLVVSVIIGIGVFFLWDDIKRNEKEEDYENLINRIHEQFGGLKEIELSDAYERAKSHINNSKEIRIIGVPDTNKSVIMEYLNATKEHLKKNKKVKYQRICQLEFNKDIEDHLGDILNTNDPFRKNLNSEVLLIDDFTSAYTYLIVDNKFLLLTLSMDGNNEAHRFYCEIESIVKYFVDHFNNVWQKEINIYNHSITTLQDLTKQIDRRQKLNSYIDEIRTSINKLDITQENMTLYAFDVLERSKERICSISNNDIALEHVVKKWNLLNTFSFFMDKLKEGDSYSTISFPEFWEDIESDEKDTTNRVHFLEKNRVALQSKANIKRIIILPKSFWHYEHSFNGKEAEKKISWNWSNIALIVKKHLKLFEEYPNYDFRIFIVEEKDYITDKENLLNFAIIEYIKGDKNNEESTKNTDENKIEKIMFAPEREKKQTNITRFNNSKNVSENNKDLFDEYENKIVQIEKDQERQLLTSEELTKIREIYPDFFKENNNKKIEQLLGIENKKL